MAAGDADLIPGAGTDDRAFVSGVPRRARSHAQPAHAGVLDRGLGGAAAGLDPAGGSVAGAEPLDGSGAAGAARAGMARTDRPCPIRLLARRPGSVRLHLVSACVTAPR